MTIQFFPAKIRWSPKKKKKKKKKVFAKIQSEFSAEIQNSNVFSAQKNFFRIQLPDKKCFLRFVSPEIRISRIRNSTLYNPSSDPFKINRFLTFKSQLKKLNCLILLLLTIYVQNTFKILHFGLNFVSDLAHVGGSKLHCLVQCFSSKP